MCMVLLIGCIDLSVGSTIALVGCVIGVLWQKAGITNSIVLIACGILVSLLIGLINGLLYTKLRLPHPFVSTMGMMQILRGIALIITNASAVYGMPKGTMWLGSATIGGFPVSFILVLIIFVVISIMLNYTTLGRNIYAVGGNKEAARLSGINVDKVINIVYIMSSFLAGLAGIVMVGRIGLAYPLSAEGYEMDAIAACVIGGCSFNGGKGNMMGTFLGALLIAVLYNGLNLLGAQSDIQKVAIGAIIIIAVFIDVTRARTADKASRAAQAKLLDTAVVKEA